MELIHHPPAGDNGFGRALFQFVMRRSAVALKRWFFNGQLWRHDALLF